jgi:di/tricarboxylate transporter
MAAIVRREEASEGGPVTLSIDAWITLALLVITFILLFATKLPPVVIFLGALTAAITLGLAPVTDLLKGFSNAGVITVGVLFMVAEGMYSTGAITLIADRIVGLPRTLTAAQVRILWPVAMGSAFLNNTPLVAMMIPVIRDIARSTRLSVSKIYIPLSYASILGGASTLIGTSTNLVIAGLIIDAIANLDAGALPIERVTIFFPTPVGLPAAIAGILFLLVAGPRLLPERREENGEEVERRLYRAEFFIAGDSYLRGKTVEASGLAHAKGFQLTSIRRSGGTESAIEPQLELREGDILAFSTDTGGLPALWATIGLTPLNTLSPADTERHCHRLVEVVISPKNSYLGRAIGTLPAPEEPSELKIVALSRSGAPPEDPLREVRIEAGDNAVLEVNDPFFYQNRNEQEYLIIKRLRGYRIKRVDRAFAATVIAGLMVVLAATGWMSILNAALLATFAMLATGCMSLWRAGRSIEWKTLVVLASAVGLESAVTASGLADAIAAVLADLGGGNPYAALTVVFIACLVMTNVITNAAAAAFMFPVAVSIAGDLGVSFMPFAAVLMLGTSYSFINPAGYQTNLMVLEPGGYETSDYIRVGLPLTIVAGIVVILLTPLVYGF